MISNTRILSSTGVKRKVCLSSSRTTRKRQVNAITQAITPVKLNKTNIPFKISTKRTKKIPCAHQKLNTVLKWNKKKVQQPQCFYKPN